MPEPAPISGYIFHDLPLWQKITLAAFVLGLLCALGAYMMMSDPDLPCTRRQFLAAVKARAPGLHGGHSSELSRSEMLDEIRRILGEHGELASLRGSLRIPFLHLAAGRGDEELVRLFALAGIDLDLRDDNGQTALHWAVGGGEVEAARLLLEHGIDPDARNTYGRTAMHDAARGPPRRGPAMIGLLVACGADVNATDDQGCTPLRWILSSEYSGFYGRTIKELRRHGAR